MPRILRTTLPDGFFHVTARGVDRAPIVRDDDDRRLFLALLAGAVRRYPWTVDTFCLMDNHWHLVVGTLRPALSAGVQWLNGVYGRAFNDRHERSGHVFGERFRCRVIESESQLGRTRRYVLANPVRAGLVEHPEDWPWSASRFGSRVV